MTYTKSQKIKSAYRNYCKSNATRLEQVYGRFSHEKARALECVKSLSADMSGTRPHILTANTFSFTCGFFAEYNGEEVFVYVTRDNVYYCNSADLD